MADRPQDWNQDIIGEFRANDGTVTTAGFGRARVLEGAERDSAWARFTADSPGFRQYEERTTRSIPVIAPAPPRTPRRGCRPAPDVGAA